MNLNGLSINMIIAQESILLDLIDSMEDEDQQRAMIEKVLAARREKKLKPKMEALVKLVYSMNEVINRMKREKPLSTDDLRAEINALKQ